LPQMTGHGDGCFKIQVSIFLKIFFGLNYPNDKISFLISKSNQASA